MKYCPKCEGCFYKWLDSEFCSVHEKEYEEWLNDEYIINKVCECGEDKWTEGTLQMTHPPTYPEVNVFRCIQCNRVQTERSPSGRVRFHRRWM